MPKLDDRVSLVGAAIHEPAQTMAAVLAKVADSVHCAEQLTHSLTHLHAVEHECRAAGNVRACAIQPAARGLDDVIERVIQGGVESHLPQPIEDANGGSDDD